MITLINILKRFIFNKTKYLKLLFKMNYFMFIKHLSIFTKQKKMYTHGDLI